ncbi:MAG: hypothetical protein HW384_2090 [Dehalococcoidia bacterium]|nr:hypothetical protein [Dehalococcoidia bacterium]
MPKLREWLPLFQRHRFCSKCQLSVEFTGAPPDNPSETLIKKIAGNRRTVSIHWLEEHIADALYYAELRHSAGVNDIGLWGSAVFGKESAKVVAEMRPEFGVIRDKDNCA